MADKITLQSIFNAAWQAFIVEGKPPACGDQGAGCEYLTYDGRKCAIGLSLPDGHPAQSNHCGLFGDVARKWSELFAFEEDWSYQQLSDFQWHLHDKYVNVVTRGWECSLEELKDAYEIVAEKFHLTVPGVA